ncbi:MAG: hypothetical protein ABIR25_07580, partial [Sphingomicrobium sp.]
MLAIEPVGALFPAMPGMGHAAEALHTHHAIATSAVATTIARSRLQRFQRARRIFNVHAHAYRRAPPGRNPG